jgi:outer membrane lipoprotein-sorting protein
MVTDMGTMKMEQIHISDGKTAWMYQPMMKMLAKVDLEKVAAETQDDSAGQKSMDISSPLEGLKEESISYVRTEDVNDEKFHIFRGCPRAAQVQQMPFGLSQMEIWIGAKNGLLRKMLMLNEKGKEMMSQSYSNIQTNVKIDDSRFKFTPPEGAQVMDMTEMTINMIKQMKEKQEQKSDEKAGEKEDHGKTEKRKEEGKN